MHQIRNSIDPKRYPVCVTREADRQTARMTEWPDGLNDGSRDRYGRGRGATPHASRPGVPAQSRGGHDHADYDSGYSQGQVYGGRGARGRRAHGAGGGPDDYPRRSRPRPRWGRRITITVLVLAVAVLAWGIGTYWWADGKLQRNVDLSIVEDRPTAGQGTNYLIVGSDSRKGMSAADRKRLHTGGNGKEGKRTDSMILLHVGANGSTAISLPRDSWVEIPPFTGSKSHHHYDKTQQTKLNAAYGQDGGPLLVRTVEHNTGLKIDHYAEIGFGGFAKLVDGVGGVEMNIPYRIKDKDSGADLQKGKQTLNGKQALAFVRTRHAFKQQDLERTKNQQKFLSALANQAATPSTVLNPWALYPTMSAGLDTLSVDKDMSLWNLGEMFFAMKDISGGEGKQINMPTSATPAPMGSLNWDKPKVHKMMEQLKNDEKVTVSGGPPGQ
jgi:LCP family protein required for cell wall assembly